MKLRKLETLCINSLNKYNICKFKLRKYTKDDCIITVLQKKYRMLFIIGKIQWKMVSQLWENSGNWNQTCGLSIYLKSSKNWNPYNKWKKKIYRREDISRNGSGIDIYPTKKVFNLELLKLIILHLPALDQP